MCLHVQPINTRFKEKNNIGYKVIYENNFAIYQFYRYDIGFNYPSKTLNMDKINYIKNRKTVNQGVLHIFTNYKNAKNVQKFLPKLGKIIKVYFDRKDIRYEGKDDNGRRSLGLAKLRVISLKHVESSKPLPTKSII